MFKAFRVEVHLCRRHHSPQCKSDRHKCTSTLKALNINTFVFAVSRNGATLVPIGLALCEWRRQGCSILISNSHTVPLICEVWTLVHFYGVALVAG